MFCIKCGNEIKGEMKFCPKCGAELPVVEKKIVEVKKAAVDVETQANKTVQTNDEKKMNTIVLIASSIVPIILVILLIMAFMGKFDKVAHDLTNGAFGKGGDVKTYDLSDGRTLTITDTMDLFELIGAPEDLIESIYECEKSPTGFYPSDDKITFLCVDGYVYVINITHEDRYNFLGVSLTSDADNLNEKFLKEFTLAEEYPISDGLTRRAYVSKNGNGLVNIDYDDKGIKTIGWTGENVELTESQNVETNDNASEIVSYADTEEKLESDADEYIEENEGDLEPWYTNQDVMYQVIVDAPDGYVNVRSGPSTDSEILFENYNGTVEQVLGEEGDWLMIGLYPYGPNPFAYVHSSQVSPIMLAPGNEYLIDGSDSGYYDESYIYGFSKWDCRLARNEIYARHGKIFKDEALQVYFENCSWYTPESEDVPDSMLNQWEIDNIKMIISYEEKMGYR